MAEADYKKDMGAFLSMANYPLVKHSDMTQETRDSAVDICMTAVEKFATDLEKCSQVYVPKSPDAFALLPARVFL